MLLAQALNGASTTGAEDAHGGRDDARPPKSLSLTSAIDRKYLAVYRRRGNHVARSSAVNCWLLPRFDEAVVGDQPNPGHVFGKTDAFLRDERLTAGGSSIVSGKRWLRSGSSRTRAIRSASHGSDCALFCAIR
jgi:hypothetical protein